MNHIVRLIRFLLRFSRELQLSRWTVFLIILTGAVSGVANVVLLALVNTALSQPGVASSAWILGFVALCVLLPLTWFLSQYLLFTWMQNTLYALRMHLCRSILNTPLRRLETVGPHRLLAALTEHISATSNAILNLPLICLWLAIILACLVYFAYLSLPLLLILTVVIVFGLALYQLPMLRATRHFVVARQALDDLIGHFRGLTQGLKELQMHDLRRQAFLEQLVEPTAQSFRRASVRGALIFSVATGWGRVILFVVLGIALFVLPRLITTDAAVLTGYTLGLFYLMTPIDMLLRALPEMAQAGVAIQQIESLELSLEPAAEQPVRQDLASDWQRIRLQGVTHSYPSENEESSFTSSFTLGPIDLEIHRGEQIFLVGGNGSGKTTLAKVLVGLYRPESGAIYLDQQVIDDAARPAYRQRFSAVFSDFHLFAQLLGLNRCQLDSEALNHLQRLRLEDRVTVQDGRLSTLDLSQGQRKRLALLTAYLEDRSFYLFDEWAADQDPYFKEIFYRQLLPQLKQRGKTVVVISHDDRYYDQADRLLKLENGQLSGVARG